MQSFDQPDGQPFNRVLLTFSDADTEARFRAEVNGRAVATIRRALTILLGGTLLLASIIDHPGPAKDWLYATIPVILLWLGSTLHRSYSRFHQPVTVALSLAIIGLTSMMFYELPPVSAALTGSAWAAVVAMYLFVALRLRFSVALAAGLVFAAGFAAEGSIIWSRMPGGLPPTGMIQDPLLLPPGTVVVVLYAGFLISLPTYLGYRIERLERLDFLRREELAAAHETSERLLTNVLPKPIAERLKSGENPVVDHFEDVSVLFADIVGFTPMSEALTPAQILDLLNEVFNSCDRLATQHGLEKIKTIGDAYMAVAGAPQGRADHAQAAIALAIDLVAAIGAVRGPGGSPLAARVGIASGPVVAGILGQQKFSYDLWGDTVNTASRMESHGLPGRIQVSASTRALLQATHEFESRGPVDIKGKGMIETFLLAASSGAAARESWPDEEAGAPQRAQPDTAPDAPE